MKIQIMLANGMWSDLEDQNRIDGLIDRVIEMDTWYAERVHRTPMTTRQEVLEEMANGKKVQFGTDWYNQLRDLDAWTPRTRVPDYPNGRKLDCGHTVFFQGRGHVSQPRERVLRLLRPDERLTPPYFPWLRL